jgi:hypothetical protein
MALSTLRHGGATAAPARQQRTPRPLMRAAPLAKAAPRGLPALPARPRRTPVARVVATARAGEPAARAAAPAPAALALVAPAPKPRPFQKLQDLLSDIMKGAAIAAVAVALVSLSSLGGGGGGGPCSRPWKPGQGARPGRAGTTRARARALHACAPAPRPHGWFFALP